MKTNDVNPRDLPPFMKRFFLTILLLFGVFACERNKFEKPSVEEVTKNSASIKTVASHRNFPSLDAWLKISLGATEDRVVEILGKPKSGSSLAEYGEFANSDNVQYQWSYGSLYPESASHPFSSDFDVVFSKGIVVELIAPFGGAAIIPSGMPTVPKLFIPEDNTVFNHYPRVIDLRWWSSSGTMPITYEVSVEVKYRNDEWGVDDGLQKSVDSLHVAMVFTGANEGRWRVRGRNQEGVGEWSDYRNFKFTH